MVPLGVMSLNSAEVPSVGGHTAVQRRRVMPSCGAGAGGFFVVPAGCAVVLVAIITL